VETLESEGRKPSIRVPLRDANTAIRILSKKKALDRKYKFTTHSQTLSIPLIRRLDPQDFTGLLRELEGAAEAEDEFEPRSSHSQSLEEVLSRTLPRQSVTERPKSYDIVGDIGILELNSNLAPYGTTIAEAMMAAHPNIRAVYAKKGGVSGPERIRPLHYLAGEPRTTTVHREFGCSFRIDLSKAFFSPRLATEHQRVARQVRGGERVVDMFAGVGPFSVLIAKTISDVRVEAVDSNPAAVNLIIENARANKVASKVHAHLGDADEVARRELYRAASRVIMNHPSASRQFVGAACNVLSSTGGVVHYYTFAEGQDPETEARLELEHSLNRVGYKIREVLANHRVREVAPMKWQVVVDAEITQQ
jgi:tRNA (guanine37-N1)-methyltransferase